MRQLNYLLTQTKHAHREDSKSDPNKKCITCWNTLHAASLASFGERSGQWSHRAPCEHASTRRWQTLMFPSGNTIKSGMSVTRDKMASILAFYEMWQHIYSSNVRSHLQLQVVVVSPYFTFLGIQVEH